MATLISTADYKTYAGISGAGQDTVLAMLLGAASAAIRRACSRDLTTGFELGSPTARTERYNGTGHSTIQLREWPVATITSVSVLDAEGTAEVLDSSSYRASLLNGILSRTGVAHVRLAQDSDEGAGYPIGLSADPQFEEGFQNYSVVYTGGYSTIPLDLQLACAKITDILRSERGGGIGLQSESLGAYSYTRADAATREESIRGLIAAYLPGVP